MNRLVAATAAASVLALGLSDATGTGLPKAGDAREVGPDRPVAGGEYEVDPGPWAAVPLTRPLNLVPEATDAAKHGNRGALAELVRRGQVTLVPPGTRVRVSGPAHAGGISIVAPVAGENAHIAGCVPDGWLKPTNPPSVPARSVRAQ